MTRRRSEIPGTTANQQSHVGATSPWAVTEEKVAEAVRRLVEVSRPRRVILFGSAARGATDARDADLLVVTQDEASSDHEHVVSMYDALVGIDMAVDLIVVPDAHLRALSDVPGYAVGEALREGVILYDAFSPRTAASAA